MEGSQGKMFFGPGKVLLLELQKEQVAYV